MKNYLIVYSTVDGHTFKISNRLSSILKRKYNVITMSLKEAFLQDVSNFDCIIIGASVRYGKHRSELYQFIKKNINIINNKKNAFFTVNVVARKIDKSTPQTNPYMQKFLRKTDWKPKYLKVFAGYIDYSKYRLIDKYTIRFIMWLTSGPTNLNKSYDFTNWNDVDSFGEEL